MNTQGTAERLKTTALQTLRGWMARELLVSQSMGEKCLLTSPFIELAISHAGIVSDKAISRQLSHAMK
jgi:hypothetical protein